MAHRRPNFLATRGSREFIYEQIHREHLEYPTGSRSLYSDLGFMLLGEFIELVSGMALDRFCQERIWKPFGLRSTAFVDLSTLHVKKLVPVTDVIAPTSRCPWRKRIMWGAVEDENAYAMGGVAGHAGLFSSALDVHTVVNRLRACHRGKDTFLPQELVQEMWSRDESIPGSTWALGWDTPSAENSSAGTRIGQHAVGHLGFTGTSLWIDLDRDAHVILLTNRVHPSRDNDRIRALRPRLHDAVFEALDA